MVLAPHRWAQGVVHQVHVPEELLVKIQRQLAHVCSTGLHIATTTPASGRKELLVRGCVAEASHNHRGHEPQIVCHRTFGCIPPPLRRSRRLTSTRLGVGAGLARHLSPERGHRQRLQETGCKRAFPMHSNMELCLLFWSRTAWRDGTTVSWGAPHTRAKLFECRVEINLSVPCSRWLPGEFLVVLVLGCNLLATVCFEIPPGVELLDVVGQVLLVGATGKERFGFNSAAVDSS